MAKVQQLLVTHTCKGKRFDDHGLDLDVLPDLFAYKELLVETAKALWRRSHPDRKNLPKNFEDGLSLKFFAIKRGSAAVPIMREYESEEQADFWKQQPADELDRAVDLVNETIVAANNSQPLPEELPKNILPLFGNYGKGLRDDESVELKSGRTHTPATYTRKAQGELLARVTTVYADKVDYTGEVRAVDLGGTFTLKLDDGSKVPGRFSDDQEAVVTRALKEHASLRLRVKGTAEFQPDGKLKSIVSVSELAVHHVGEVSFDPTARPIWEIIEEIGAAVPAEAWDNVPTDGAQNLDHYLYGHAKKS